MLVLQWCIKGYCEAIGKRKRIVGPVVKNPTHGHWSSWNAWNSCSRTCGVGVRFRSRQCDNPKWEDKDHVCYYISNQVDGWMRRPADGGKACRGRSEEYELCNTDVCPEWTDARAEQCASIPLLVNMTESSRWLTWIPWQPQDGTFAMDNRFFLDFSI